MTSISPPPTCDGREPKLTGERPLTWPRFRSKERDGDIAEFKSTIARFVLRCQMSFLALLRVSSRLPLLEATSRATRRRAPQIPRRRGRSCLREGSAPEQTTQMQAEMPTSTARRGMLLAIPIAPKRRRTLAFEERAARSAYMTLAGICDMREYESRVPLPPTTALGREPRFRCRIRRLRRLLPVATIAATDGDLDAATPPCGGPEQSKD